MGVRVTTTSQSKRLVAAGMPLQTSDGYTIKQDDIDYIFCENSQVDPEDVDVKGEKISMWTLGALLEALPDYVSVCKCKGEWYVDITEELSVRHPDVLEALVQAHLLILENNEEVPLI